MNLSAQEIKALKAIEKPFGLLDTKTKELIHSLIDDLERVYAGAWLRDYDDINRDFTYRLRQDYPEPKSYEERQTNWIKENDIKIGDKVRVTRKAEDYENGWEWENAGVGKDLSLMDANKLGVKLSSGYYYPYFVLEKVVEEEKKYLWVFKKVVFHTYQIYSTEIEARNVFNSIGATHYAKLIDCQRADGSLDESKFIEIK